jgi:hypothetical protein
MDARPATCFIDELEDENVFDSKDVDADEEGDW